MQLNLRKLRHVFFCWGYVHTKTIVNANDSKRIFLSPSRRRRSSFTYRFQIYPLWSAFWNLCVYGECFHRLGVDGRPKRIKKFAFTIVCVYNRLRVDGAWVSFPPSSYCSLTGDSSYKVPDCSSLYLFCMDWHHHTCTVLSGFICTVQTDIIPS